MTDSATHLDESGKPQPVNVDVSQERPDLDDTTTEATHDPPSFGFKLLAVDRLHTRASIIDPKMQAGSYADLSPINEYTPP